MGPMAQAEDSELAGLAAIGDAGAFGLLVGRYQRLMYGVCRRITCNDQDALDALQEALVLMWQRIGMFEGRSAMSTWLHRIAANAAIDEVRRRARRAVQTDVSARTAGARQPAHAQLRQLPRRRLTMTGTR